ncbi:uncharacterized protein [Dermacentor albipictus]|uniref:uncharacterized protein n=1 Tax=Dermacentor albipictus TaxID=60249 RepID=UPI0038FCE667
MIMVHSAAAGPLLGLLILAVAFPFVHAKGAGISTVLTFVGQLFLVWQRLRGGVRSPQMEVTLDFCPENVTHYKNSSIMMSNYRLQNDGNLFLVSPFWGSFIGSFSTVLLGVLASLVTGECRSASRNVLHVNRRFAIMWQKLGFISSTEGEWVEPLSQHTKTTTASVLPEEQNAGNESTDEKPLPRPSAMETESDRRPEETDITAASSSRKRNHPMSDAGSENTMLYSTSDEYLSDDGDYFTVVREKVKRRIVTASSSSTTTTAMAKNNDAAHSMLFLPETPTDDLNRLNRELRTNSAPVLNRLTNNILRNLDEAAMEQLTEIMNECWKTGVSAEE